MVLTGVLLLSVLFVLLYSWDDILAILCYLKYIVETSLETYISSFGNWKSSAQAIHRVLACFERNPVCSLLKPSKAVARGRAVATPLFPFPLVLPSAYPLWLQAPSSSSSLFEHLHSFCPQDWVMSSSSILLGCFPTCLSLLNYIQVCFLPSSDICQPPSLASHPWKTNPKMKHKQVRLHFIPLALNLTTS